MIPGHPCTWYTNSRMLTLFQGFVYTQSPSLLLRQTLSSGIHIPLSPHGMFSEKRYACRGTGSYKKLNNNQALKYTETIKISRPIDEVLEAFIKF